MKGYPTGFRIFTNATNNVQRAALALGIDPTLSPLDALKAWMAEREGLELRKPVQVHNADFLKKSDVGDAVDLSKFPVPHWHLKDGGPYIGSGSLVIIRDPDVGWINASIYRVQVHARNKVTIQFDHQGRHGAIIAKKYWEQGKRCPVAVINGEDPALFIAGFEYLPEGPVGVWILQAPSKARRWRFIPDWRPDCRSRCILKIVLQGELPLDVTCQKGLLGSFPAIMHPRRGCHRR